MSWTQEVMAEAAAEVRMFTCASPQAFLAEFPGLPRLSDDMRKEYGRK